MVPMISLQFPLCPQFWKPCPQFWKSEEGCQKWPILTTQKLNMMAKKKVFSQIHIGMCFLQKNGFKLVKFGLCGSIYILHPAIGGSHPVPCLSTQLAERQGTAMYQSHGVNKLMPSASSIKDNDENDNDEDCEITWCR